MTEKATYPTVDLPSKLSILVTRFPEHNLEGEKLILGYDFRSFRVSLAGPIALGTEVNPNSMRERERGWLSRDVLYLRVKEQGRPKPEAKFSFQRPTPQ